MFSSSRKYFSIISQFRVMNTPKQIPDNNGCPKNKSPTPNPAAKSAVKPYPLMSLMNFVIVFFGIVFFRLINGAEYGNRTRILTLAMSRIGHYTNPADVDISISFLDFPMD